MKHRIFLGAILLSLAGCAQPPDGDTGSRIAYARLSNAQGVRVGSAAFTDVAAAVKFAVQVSNMTPGVYEVLLRESGRCDPPDFAATEPDHEYARLRVDPAGSAAVEALAPGLSVRSGPNSLFRQGGAAILLQSGGARVACGILTR